MGTEAIFPVGTVLTRKAQQDDEHDQLRVVGAGKELIVTSNIGFTTNYTLDITVAREQYTAAIPSEVIHEPGRRRPALQGLSPEEQFRLDAINNAAAEEADAAAKAEKSKQEKLAAAESARQAKLDAAKAVTEPKPDEVAAEGGIPNEGSE